jgi:iron only hydrogenase large subunit-like protein/nitrogen-specific signal transduction histidine kinase
MVEENKHSDAKQQLVSTIKERCRVCYTCVRECPAKAIRIAGGQAEVISTRCIACGNCIKVCSQYAKVFRKEIIQVRELLASDKPVVALIAPSFAAEFSDIPDYKLFVGMLKSMGFSRVTEVAFGADLVARKYKSMYDDDAGIPSISSDCPAVVSYIERYFPDLVARLATTVSPMVAMARVVRQKYGSDIKTVFIGPCIAKKDESNEVDQVLTFRELREMFDEPEMLPSRAIASEFDPPCCGKGAIFPVSRGLLNTMDIREDVFEGNVIVAEGRPKFQEAIREFESGFIQGPHLELLCCEACILGPGMSPYPFFASSSKRYAKRAMVVKYVKQKMASFDRQAWEKEMETYSSLDLSRTFEAKDMRTTRPSEERIAQVLQRMGKFSPKDYLDCGACGYDSCDDHAIAIINGLAENEMCLPYAIEKLHKYIREFNLSNEKLATTQEALRQSEKLAGMGQLSAGIAHELNNPLGVITMYSNILKEELQADDPMQKDLELIVEQANRCKKIVGGLLNFARKNQVNFTESDINNLTENSIKSVLAPANIKISLKSDVRDPMAWLDYDQMSQVLTNLAKNAVEALPDGGYIRIELKDTPEQVIFQLTDDGIGISKENMDRVFTPFFTTKGPGKGTGLGLPIIYGIVKMHKGDITVQSNADPHEGPTGTTFRITLPRQRPQQS